jgi:hypothetical protein
MSCASIPNVTPNGADSQLSIRPSRQNFNRVGYNALQKSIFGSRYFPEVLWPETFSYLPPSDLAQVARICKIWSTFLAAELMRYKIQRFQLAFCISHHAMIMNGGLPEEKIHLHQEAQLKIQLGGLELLKMVKEDPMIDGEKEKRGNTSLLSKIVHNLFRKKPSQPILSRPSIYVRLQKDIAIKSKVLFQMPVAINDYHVRDAIKHLSPPDKIKIVSSKTSAKTFLKNLQKAKPHTLYINQSLLQNDAFLKALERWQPSHQVKFVLIASFPLLVKEKKEGSSLPNFLKLLVGKISCLEFTTFELNNADILALAEWIEKDQEEQRLVISEQALIKQTYQTSIPISNAIRKRRTPFCLELLLFIKNPRWRENFSIWSKNLYAIEQENPCVEMIITNIFPSTGIQFNSISDSSTSFGTSLSRFGKI